MSFGVFKRDLLTHPSWHAFHTSTKLSHLLLSVHAISSSDHKSRSRYSNDTQPWSFLLILLEEKILVLPWRQLTVWWPSYFFEGRPQRRRELREGEGKTASSGHCLGSESRHPWKQVPWILQSREPKDSFPYVYKSAWAGFLSLATWRSLTNTESHPNPRLWVSVRLGG